MSLSWASHWNYAGMILDWAEKSGITAPKVQTNNATGPLRKTTVDFMVFLPPIFGEMFCFFFKENTTYVPGTFNTLQVVPPILRGADDKIANRCPVSYSGSPSQNFKLNTNLEI